MEGMDHCPVEPEINELTGSIKLLTEKIDTLVNLNRDIIRWLLLVICVIALGRSAIDLGKDFFKGNPVHAEAKA